MKKIKLLTTLLLSSASVAALASCGTKVYPGVNKPGVSVLLDGEDSSKYITYEVVGGEENLKFGETDVVVNITPNKFYSFYYFVPGKEEAEKQYWGRSGYKGEAENPVKPFNSAVYLGSRNAAIRYKLAENVAWTITDLSTFETKTIGTDTWQLVTEEKIEIKVKKEFFQKAITINLTPRYDQEGDSHTLLTTYSNVITASNNGCVVASGDKLDETVSFSDKDSDFTVLNDENAMVLVYDINNKVKNNAENARVISELKNELLSFSGYDQLDDKQKYSKFEVIGVKKKDSTEETLSVYDPKKEEQDFEVEVTNAGNRIIFYLKWTSLIEAIPGGDPYNEKYKDFKVRLTPSPIVDVGIHASAEPIDKYQLQYGFFNECIMTGETEPHLQNFSRKNFVLQYNDVKSMSFDNIAVSAIDDVTTGKKTAPYFVFVKGKDADADGNPTWPTVSIEYTDINGKKLSQSIDATVITSKLGSGLKYCENIYWRIVCINSGEQPQQDPWENKTNNLFVIYPTQSTASFYMPDGGARLAKSVTINIGNI